MPTKLVQGLLDALIQPRWRWALMTAVLSDVLAFGVVLFPPGQWLLDAVTAVVLFTVLGFRWALVSALAVEAVPALQVFPAWTLVVAALASTDARRSAPRKEEVSPGDRSVQMTKTQERQ